jgi:hypothetical protein
MPLTTKEHQMTEHNPEVERQLEVLANLCCEAVQGGSMDVEQRAEPILKSLLMSGYERTAPTTLQTDLEARVKAQCAGSINPHSEKLIAVTRQIQAKYKKLVLWESRQPEGYPPAKSANISSSTDA